MISEQMDEGFNGSLWAWFFFKKWDFFDSVRKISIFYILCALVFGFLAVITTFIYIPLREEYLPYADFNGCLQKSQQKMSRNNINRECQVSFEIKKQITPPIHFLYYVENTYINHRGYLNSYSKSQLQGNIIDQKTAISLCSPFVYNRDLGKNVSWSGKPLDPDAIASPCGFKAFLYFNDTFKLNRVEGKQVTNIKIDQSQIGKMQGLGINFQSRNPDEEWIDPKNQHFVMWMQTQSLMTKKKLWGRINQPLKPGNYSLLAQNNYKIGNMRIIKGILISQASTLGGKSYIIPIAFISIAIGCLIFAILFYRKFKELDKQQKDE